MGRVIIKRPEELQIMRESGRLLASVFRYLDSRITQGMSTMGINIAADKKLSAQWEHTIAVTADGYEVLTLRDEERESLAAASG